MTIDLNPSMLLTIARIFVTFVNNATGESKTIWGTGFWYGRDEQSKVFVTNKHNVDPKLKLGDDTSFILASLAIECRSIEKSSGKPYRATKQITVDLKRSRLVAHSSADVAVISNIVWAEPVEGFEPSSMGGEFADSQFFQDRLRLTDRVFFLGFPGSPKANWWDTAWNLPVARDAIIASWPAKPFENVMIKTADTLLVSGFSFGGSSGSPVFYHQKGLKMQGTKNISIDNKSFTPATLMGIMSGHFQTPDEKTPEMFRHTGLSYLTRSTAILECIQQCVGPV